MRTYQNFGRQNGKGGYRENYRNEAYNNNNRRNGRSINNSRSRSQSRVTTDRDRIRCYGCCEYNHFTKDCPMAKEKRETEQIQQLFNLDEEQTSLKH